MPTILAMHMLNELLSPRISAATLLLAAVVVAAASLRTGRRLSVEKAPLMGVMGAFVFAAQMINFTLPLMPGTSGHLGGGVLLAILLGPAAAIVSMTGILIVQCLLFQDGGLLALGCNIINMGVVPCLLGWCIYRLLLGPVGSARPARQYLAAWGACTVGVAGGAALVPLEAYLSGVLRIDVREFLQVMIGVHLLIGLVEGAITFAVLAYLRKVRPAALGLAEPQGQTVRPRGKFMLASLMATALLLAGVASWFASTHPDGLEWTYQDHFKSPDRPAMENPSPLVAAVDRWQAKWSPMSDYTKRSAPLGQEATAEEGPSEGQAAWPNVSGWGSLAGVLGTLLTLAVLYLVAKKLRRRPAVSAQAQSPQPS
jgi:cobalt/nickel transport system permease protein